MPGKNPAPRHLLLYSTSPCRQKIPTIHNPRSIAFFPGRVERLLPISFQMKKFSSSRLASLAHLRSQNPICLTVSVAGLLVCQSPSSQAETYVPTAGTTSWSLNTNWNPATVPNAVGAAALFDSPTAARTITLDAAITAGSLSFNINTNFTNTISNGTNGSLTLDAAGAGPATITTNGTTTSLITISATQAWPDSVTINTISATSTSVAGALTLTGLVSGAGGLTKDGPGTLTLATTAKTYLGATMVNAGRLRLSALGSPASSSSVTVASGAQITFTGASGTFALGAGSVNLNGIGLAAFPGAIRADQVGSIVPNAIVLQSLSSINVPGSTSTLTLNGVVSGPGRLEVGTLPGDPLTQGKLTLNGDNGYLGGTSVIQGTLELSASSADLGFGDVTVDGVLTSGASVANGKLSILTGVANGISDAATLTLTGGSGVGAADGGFVTLGAGINETVGGLVLGGAAQGNGTYGSTASTATFRFDEYFAGTGIVTVIPEPGAATTLLGGLCALLGLRRSRRTN